MSATLHKHVGVSLGAAVAAALLVLPAMVGAGTQDFELVNETGVEIHEVYISPSDSNNWEEDVLGVDTLPDGESVEIRFKGHDECDWDIKITDGEGGEIEWTDLDLCSISTVTLHLKGKKAWADLD